MTQKSPHNQPTDEQGDYSITQRNQVKRLPKRAQYDRQTIYAIIDEALICHVGFIDGEQPYVIPSIHARSGDRLFLHGAPASRLIKHIAAGKSLCITATLVDGIVFARSVFHHSMNYRSAVLFGRGKVLDDPMEKLEALEAISDHVARGRWQEAREPNEQEVNATTVVAIEIESASAKIRSGPPVDDEADYSLQVWAGVLPLSMQADEVIDDPRLESTTAAPEYIRHYQRAVD